MVGTGKLSRVSWCKFHDIWFLVHLTISIFILDFERLQAKLHFPQKRQENATTWCILVVVSLLSHVRYDELSLSKSVWNPRQKDRKKLACFFCVPNKIAWLFRY